MKWFGNPKRDYEKNAQALIVILRARIKELEDSVFQYGIENTKLQVRIDELEHDAVIEAEASGDFDKRN